MLEWFARHGSAIQSVSGIATAVIWIVYLQLIVSGMRRQRRSDILISLGSERATGARCYVSNLGMDPTYLASIAVKLHHDDRATTVDLTDAPEPDGASGMKPRTHQGPMNSGECRGVGNLEELLRPACTTLAVRPGEVVDFTIRVTAFTASTSTLVAAERDFWIDRSSDRSVPRARTLETRQIRSRRARRRIKAELQQQM